MIVLVVIRSTDVCCMLELSSVRFYKLLSELLAGLLWPIKERFCFASGNCYTLLSSPAQLP